MTEYKSFEQMSQEVAEAIAAAMGADVEIVNKDLIRVAATGRLRQNVGQKLFYSGIVYSNAMETGKQYVLENPGKEEICTKCVCYGKCIYKTVIYAPILVEEKAIGVISLSAFDETQRQRLISHEISVLLDFVQKMANLLSSKAKEQEMLRNIQVMTNRLNEVINTVDEAIVAVDYRGVITHLNKLAENIGLTEDCIGSDLKDYYRDGPISEVIANGKPIRVVDTVTLANGARRRFLITARPIMVNDNQVGAVAYFKDYGVAQTEAMHLINTSYQVYLKDIIGSSTIMTVFKEKIKKISLSNSTVLLVGETGTGKELTARSIHAEGPRANKPFVAVNCGALPETLIESEIFGYEAGAFTGAKKAGKPGKFELAQGGTIFLDEIENMPLYLQPKLLRVLQEKTVERLGGTDPIAVDVRIIAATNENPEELVKNGRLRIDLYHRLNVIPLIIPPLRDREEDIMVLADYFLKKYALLMKRNIKGFTPQVKECFLSYSWPGNVRELQNAIEYAVNLEDGEYIGLANLPAAFQMNPEIEEIAQDQTIISMEKEAILKALQKYGTDEEGKINAAKSLGISRATIYRRIKKFNINVD